MPICPSCYATIHTGAEKQCPVCGYSLKRAQAVFGARPLEFTRVVDEAGVLSHSERREIMQVLQDWERRIPPVALGIFITSHGQLKDFRAHAHWVLNQAIIHHPSFGKRELSRAIEDAELSMDRPHPLHREEPTRFENFVHWWEKTGRMVLDAVHPYPPPVRQEWMLVLVLDVQLEVACFSWGYMLDPYVNPDSINSAIVGARLYFRERAMTVGLRKVMKAAMLQLAARSYSVNKRMKKAGRQVNSMLLSAGLCGFMLTSEPVVAQGLTNLPDDETAEEVEEDVAEEVEEEPSETTAQTSRDQSSPPSKPASTSSPVPLGTSGNAASLSDEPAWSVEDRRRILAGEIPHVYQMLGIGSAPVAKSSTRKKRTETQIPKIFFPKYKQADKDGLIDPQVLLSDTERADIECTLRLINGRSRYHTFIAILAEGQRVPIELAPSTLARLVAPPGEYAVVLMYSMGDAPIIDVGYHEIEASDANRHAWLKKAQDAATLHGGGVDGLLAAVRVLHTCLSPVTANLPPLEQRSEVRVPLVPIEMREEDVAEEVTYADELRSAWESPQIRRIVAFVGGFLGFFLLILTFGWFRRRSGRLFPSSPDVRLSSPYGAGVSRNVKYLEGREEKKKNDYL